MNLFDAERELLERAEKLQEQAHEGIRKKFQQVEGDLDATIDLWEECPHCVTKALMHEGIRSMILEEMGAAIYPGVIITAGVDGQPVSKWRVMSYGAIMWLENISEARLGQRAAYDIQNASLWRDKTCWLLTWSKENLTLRIWR